MEIQAAEIIEHVCREDIPYSPNGKRIVANDLIRSALFTVANKKEKRTFFKDEAIAAYGQTLIKYRGEELRQDDADVFMLILHALSHDFFVIDYNEMSIEFMPFSFIRLLGWPKTSYYKQMLFEILSRLSATSLTIKNKDTLAGIVVSLVRKFEFEDAHGEGLKNWKVYLENEIIILLKPNGYTKINWDQRLNLTPLAKWLHAFYSSHEKPYALKVSTIFYLCGTRTKKLSHFKENLRGALNDLVKIGFLRDFYIDVSNTLHVLRIGQDSYAERQ